jgi:hypothetical protein
MRFDFGGAHALALIAEDLATVLAPTCRCSRSRAGPTQAYLMPSPLDLTANRANVALSAHNRSSRLMLVLRLVLGLAALVMLHAVLFAQAPASAQARAGRSHR